MSWYLEILEVRYSPNAEELFEEFWKILKAIQSKLMIIYKKHEVFRGPVPYSPSGICEYCEKETENLVVHHDHFNGKFLGYACASCNSSMKVSKDIRVFFHNLKGYDSHFIIKYGLKVITREKELSPPDDANEEEDKPIEKINVLGRSKEKLFSIKIGHFLFLDSLCHLDTSLSQLIKGYVKERRFVKFLPDWYTHKEAYPYEWFNTYEKFELPFLPEREAFYSFLAEVFEKYRELSMKSYKLDPAWYVSAPSLFYDAMKLYSLS
jgi:hypothetical protein